MAKPRRTSRTRVIGPLVRWALYLLGVGVLLAAAGAAFALTFEESHTVRFELADVNRPLAAAGGGFLISGAVFLALAFTKARVQLDKLAPEEELVARAASAMVFADGDAAAVEVEALRTWIERRYDFAYEFDELMRLANENKDNRAGLVRAVEERRAGGRRWGPTRDAELREAIKYVIVADLRVREPELAYFRQLAAALGDSQEQIDAFERKLAELKREMVEFVIERLLEEDAAAPVSRGRPAS